MKSVGGPAIKMQLDLAMIASKGGYAEKMLLCVHGCFSLLDRQHN